MESLLIWGVIGGIGYWIYRAAQGGGSSQSRHRPARESTDDGLDIHVTFTTSRSSASGERSDPSVKADDCWTPQGQTITVHGVRISRGLLYKGRGLAPERGYVEIEPALVNPSLPVDLKDPDYAGNSMDYYPSYDELTPQARGAYLRFLAEPDWVEGYSPGHVFLYFYGLERRVLGDALGGNQVATAEVRTIIDTVRQMLDAYGEHNSVRHYLARFIDVASVLFEVPVPEGAYEARRTSNEIPTTLKLALGRHVAAGEPIPVEIALAVAYTDPEIRRKVAMERCREEFDRLFPIIYREQCGDGIKVKPNKRQIPIQYHPASAGGPRIQRTLDLPDITQLKGPRTKIQKVVDRCCEALGPLSRHRLNNPDDTTSPQALALVPHAILDQASPGENSPMGMIRQRLDTALEKSRLVRVPLREFVQHFEADTTNKGKISAKGRRMIENLLAGWSIGLAPGIEFTGGSLQPSDKVVVFRLQNPEVREPSLAFQQALVHMRVLGLAYAHTAHDLSPAQSRLVHDYVQGLNGLTADEALRLEAVLRWLMQQRTRHLAGVRKALPEMSQSEIDHLLQTLLRFVSIDGVVGAGCIRDLKSLMPLFGQDSDTLYERLHRLIAEPQEVRPASQGQKGGRIPPPPKEDAAGATADGNAQNPAAQSLNLDHSAIAAREAESAAIGETLHEIFADETAATAESSPVPNPGEAASQLAGLDAAHSGFLAALAQFGERVPLQQARTLADEHHLLFAGAVDQINEATLDTVGAELLELDDDDLLVDLEILKEVRQ